MVKVGNGVRMLREVSRLLQRQRSCRTPEAKRAGHQCLLGLDSMIFLKAADTLPHSNWLPWMA